MKLLPRKTTVFHTIQIWIKAGKLHPLLQSWKWWFAEWSVNNLKLAKPLAWRHGCSWEFAPNKNRFQNITHCYSFIMRVVLLTVFPHSAQPTNSIPIPEPPTMTHSSLGDGRRDCWLACFGCFTDRAVSHAAPEWQSWPIRFWQLLTPTLRCVCLSFVGVNAWLAGQ